MFVVTDYTRPIPHDTISVDSKDVRDIILGITGDETIANKYYNEVANMHIGDEIIANPYFAVTCVLDVEV